MELFHFTHDEIFLAFFSAALVYLTVDKIFASFYQEKDDKPAAGDIKK
jgi:hypothetical protein